MKSELSGANVMTKPAIVEAKDKTAGAEAGSDDWTLEICLPPTPRATTKTMSVGIHMSRSYHDRTLIPQNDTCTSVKFNSTRR